MIVGGVGVREILDPGLAAPDHGPVLVQRRREDVIVLGVDSVEKCVGFPGCFEVGMHVFNQRAAGKIAIDDHLEDVVMQVGPGEIPIVIPGLVEEVELVQSLDPTHLDLDIEIAAIVIRASSADSIGELVHADGIGVGNHCPVVGFAIDAGDLIGRELEDFELNSGTFERHCREMTQD